MRYRLAATSDYLCETEMKNDSSDSVFHEPHLQRRAFSTDPSEYTAEGTDVSSNQANDSVWNEPNQTVQHGAGSMTPYAVWLQAGRDTNSVLVSWLRVLGLALIAGPIAVVTAFWGAGQTAFSMLALTVVGPVVEEMGKVLCLLITVELRPYWIISRSQIFFGGLMAGLAFAVIENWIYFNIYIPEPEPWLITWRWTVCVALHTGCSLIASLGVARIWSDVFAHGHAPRVELGFPYWCTAMVIHGLYNFSMVIMNVVMALSGD